MSSLSDESSPETLELFLTGLRVFLPITDPSLSSESCWVFVTSGEDECDFLDVLLFWLAELDLDLLLFAELALLRLVERLAWDESLLPLTADWLEITEPAGVADRPEVADTADATLEALLAGEGERDPAGDLVGLLAGDADPELLLERDLDPGDGGSEPDGVWAWGAGEADLEDWLLLLADEELVTDSESLASIK